MASNCIHYFDLVEWWTNGRLEKINNKKLNKWFESKRKGFYDIHGEILAEFSNGTILSGGEGLTGAGNRTRLAWLTERGSDLTYSDDLDITLSLALASGTWSATVNDGAAVTGTFNTDHIKGIDRYQMGFATMSSGDYIDIDEISVSVIPEPASVSLVALAGGSIMMLRRRFAR